MPQHQALTRPLLLPLSAQPAACLGGLAWRAALAAGAAAAAALALARSQLAVQYESLTYVRLLGVRLETRRRCGLAGGAAFLPLRSLQAIIIHEASEEDAEGGEDAAGCSSSGGLCAAPLTGTAAVLPAESAQNPWLRPR